MRWWELGLSWGIAQYFPAVGMAFEESRALSLATATSAAQLLVTALFCALLPSMNNPVPTR